MTSLVSVAYLILMIAAALGGGAVILRITGVLYSFNYTERVVLAFGIGFGLLGWSIFGLALTGFIGKIELTVILLGFVFGTIFLKPKPDILKGFVKPDIYGSTLIAFIGILFALDILEGLSPPSDGDSLAYHFALPKAFLARGVLFPTYQAVEGSIPLLQQMTYLSALGTGGEKTMTLWCMITGWAAAALIFVISRRFVSFNWALSIALVFLSTPAIIYGAGSGQVEVRNAIFVLIAALAISEARNSKQLRYAILAGLAAGFFVASKYTGLIFAFSGACLLLFQKRWLASVIAYCSALVIAGGQWYAWNIWATGDPIFPILYGLIEYNLNTPWNSEIHAAYKSMISEKVLPSNLFWLFGYPVKATLFADTQFESLRVGLGPVALLLIPFFGYGIWIFKDRISLHPLLIFGSICFIAYAIWFFIGPSQRVRHLLPLYPLLLICFSVLAIKASECSVQLLHPLRAVFALVIPLQLLGGALYGMNYLRYFVLGQDRQTFLLQNVSRYRAVIEARKILTSSAHLLVTSRNLVYYFDNPVYYANPNTQTLVEVHKKAGDPKKLWLQLRQMQISHILLPFGPATKISSTKYKENIESLKRERCLKNIKEFDARLIVSRTLPFLEPHPYRVNPLHRKGKFTLTELTPNSCSYPQNFERRSN